MGLALEDTDSGESQLLSREQAGGQDRLLPFHFRRRAAALWLHSPELNTYRVGICTESTIFGSWSLPESVEWKSFSVHAVTSSFFAVGTTEDPNRGWKLLIAVVKGGDSEPQAESGRAERDFRTTEPSQDARTESLSGARSL